MIFTALSFSSGLPYAMSRDGFFTRISLLAVLPPHRLDDPPHRPKCKVQGHKIIPRDRESLPCFQRTRRFARCVGTPRYFTHLDSHLTIGMCPHPLPWMRFRMPSASCFRTFLPSTVFPTIGSSSRSPRSASPTHYRYTATSTNYPPRLVPRSAKCSLP